MKEEYEFAKDSLRSTFTVISVRESSDPDKIIVEYKSRKDPDELYASAWPRDIVRAVNIAELIRDVTGEYELKSSDGKVVILVLDFGRIASTITGYNVAVFYRDQERVLRMRWIPAGPDGDGFFRKKVV